MTVAPCQEVDDLKLLARALGVAPESELAASYARSGGPAGLLGLPPAELRHRLAITSSAARRLAAGLELGRRAVIVAAPLAEPLRGGADIWRFLAPRFAGCRVECFRALYLDAKGRLQHEEQISEGTLTASLVHPREVFGPALVHRAAAVVVAHNHPSGDPEPSAEDRATTRRLVRAGRLLGVELLDHVVCGAGRYVSFLEQGWM
ncbi:MAG: hypothetical protein H8E31_14270 [Planctomycetes bacterium]|nr:hypothetical protein [Planctomycetota bacterium]